jgi:hypothetical protein
MSTMHQSRSLVLGIATVFAFTLLAPVAITAQEEVGVLAPVAAPAVDETSAEDVRTTRAIAAERALRSGDIGSLQEEHLYAIVAAAPSWDESSGYGSVEATRAAASALLAPAAAPSWDETSGYGSVEDSRAAAAALLAPVAAPSWDETSGYGAVEASRATIGHPAASTTAEQTRLVAAQQALLSQDLGSLQEDALTAIVDASSADAEASVDNALAPTSAELLAQFRAIELALSRSLGAVE